MKTGPWRAAAGVVVWVVAAALGVGVLGWGAPARGDVIDVYVYSYAFSVNPRGGPVRDAVITVGDTVRWVWEDGSHTTTSVSGQSEQWDAVISSGSPTYMRTFTNVGEFVYYCRPHGTDNGDGTASGMVGRVIVLPAGAGACCLPYGGGCAVMSEAPCVMAGGAFLGVGAVCTPDPCSAAEVTATLMAAADTVLYEAAAPNVANGSGQHLFAGKGANGLVRRGLVRFDLSAIPAGAQIVGAELRLYCNEATGGPVDLSLHRMTASWGEGASDAPGDEGEGTAAAAGDATWYYRFYSTASWGVLGGEYDLHASATTSVPAEAGVYASWSGPGVLSDVQMWAAMPGMNHGWVLVGDAAASGTVRRFDSRQGPMHMRHPVLEVTYIPAELTGACCLPDGSCVTDTEGNCVAMGGTYHGHNTTCGMVSCPVVLTPFVDALPIPPVAQPVSGEAGGAAHYEIAATEQYQQLHSELPPTRVWGYAGVFPGPTIEARRGEPVTVLWKNDLRDAETGLLRSVHHLTVDTCLHGPDVTGEVPVVVTHLHGGRVRPESDGDPEASFAPGEQAPNVYEYPNDQPASTLWYHDHAMGITRLNVYMGLAGFYLIRDEAEAKLGLPSGKHEIPLAIMDRSLAPDGSLRYPEMWHEHHFGDVILVNGKVWPYLEVDRGKYRFRLLNGSGSRAYTLALEDGATFWQIGSDTGLLASPVAMTALTLLPGERADVVVDFSGYAPGTRITLVNSAPAPYPGQPGVGVVPEVMQFVVGSAKGHTGALPGALASVPRIPESEALLQRDFELALTPDPHCSHHGPGAMWTINGLMWDDITEFPRLGTTEVWAWVNRSSMSHPMHMHLVSFQVLDRQEIDSATGVPTGPRVPPDANEMGWKDTVRADPGQITRVIARFEGWRGNYPYHCHILEHEDHEMMRQFRTLCPADMNGDGALTVADFTAFREAYLAGERAGDFNNDGAWTVADFAAFRAAYLAPCE